MNTGNKLDKLAIKNGTDKSSKIHNFASFYEQYLDSDLNVKLLEVGIGEDDMPSLKMWRDYFTNGEIFGVDIRHYQHEEERIHTYVVDQSNEKDLEKFMSTYGPFDIIIDDGSHYCSHQLNTLNLGFEHLSKNGLIIIEDLHTSLEWWHNGANIDTEVTALDVIRNLNKSMYVDIYQGKTGGHESTSITSVIIPNRSPNV